MSRPIVTVLHYLRSLIPDILNCDGTHKLYDDDFYRSRLMKKHINPDADKLTVKDEVYDAIVLDIWYTIAGDTRAVRQLEEIGLLTGEYDAHKHINSLKMKNSRFNNELYGSVEIP